MIAAMTSAHRVGVRSEPLDYLRVLVVERDGQWLPGAGCGGRSSGRFGCPAIRFHADAVQLGFSLAVGARANAHWSSTGSHGHPGLLYTGVAVPPEVSRVRTALAVGEDGGRAATEQSPHREDQGGEP